LTVELRMRSSLRSFTVLVTVFLTVAIAGCTSPSDVATPSSEAQPAPATSDPEASVQWYEQVVADRSKGPEVAAALAALSTDPQSVFSEQAKQEVSAAGTDLSQAVPSGSQVTVNDSTWAPDGVGGGTISVTITAPGEQPVEYLALVTMENGAWKIDATLPAEEAP
jgi:hypothetical protein